MQWKVQTNHMVHLCDNFFSFCSSTEKSFPWRSSGIIFYVQFALSPSRFIFLAFIVCFETSRTFSSNAMYLFQVSFLKYDINVFFVTHRRRVFPMLLQKVLELTGSCKYFSCIFVCLCISVWTITQGLSCIGSSLQLTKIFLWVFPLAGEEHEKILHVIILKTGVFSFLQMFLLNWENLK